MQEERTSPIERAKRLKEVMEICKESKEISKKEFCDRYNISQTSLHYWENAVGGGLTEKGARKIANAMREEEITCSVNWLMTGLGISPQPIKSSSSFKSKVDTNRLEEITETKLIKAEIEHFCDIHYNAITMIIKDDGMEPLYLVNDYVGGKKLDDSDISHAIDKDCIIEIPGTEPICRRITHGQKEGAYNLYCINPKANVFPPFLYNVEVISVSLIIRLWRT